jgi:hypothetical protein
MSRKGDPMVRHVNGSGQTRRAVLAGFAAGAVFGGRRLAAEPAPMVTVWKDPSCGCCSGWVDHLRRSGFTVAAIDTADLAAVKAALGVPGELASCHTAKIDAYVIEGHVPAAAIRRLLAERPAALGLAVPGMPIGSPGMEGGTPQLYDVILFAAQSTTVYGRFIGSEPR